MFYNVYKPEEFSVVQLAVTCHFIHFMLLTVLQQRCENRVVNYFPQK